MYVHPQGRGTVRLSPSFNWSVSGLDLPGASGGEGHSEGRPLYVYDTAYHL